MMESVKVRQRTGQDGILHLEVPVGLADQDMEVILIYQPVPLEADTDIAASSPEASAAGLNTLEQVQAMVRKYVPEGKSLVDELIADRRAEAERE